MPANCRSKVIASVFGLCAVLACALALAQQAVLEVITLNYRNADDVIPILRPLVPPPGTLSGMQNRLIVRTTPANLEELKRVLASLDARPRQLLVTVRQDTDTATERKSAEISGKVGIGDHAQVAVPGGRPRPGDVVVRGRGGNTSVQVRASDNESMTRDNISQTVRVMEGSAAFVRIGRSIPVGQRQVVQGTGGAQIVDSTAFQDIDRGFWVLPRVSGDRVTLEISTANDRVQDRRSRALGPPPEVGVQQTDTVVSGRFGEWIEIGALDQRGYQQEQVILGRESQSRSDQGRVMLKVDEVR